MYPRSMGLSPPLEGHAAAARRFPSRCQFDTALRCRTSPLLSPVNCSPGRSMGQGLMPPDLLRFFTSQASRREPQARSARTQCAPTLRGLQKSPLLGLAVGAVGASRRCNSRRVLRSKKTQDLTRCPKLFRVEQRIDERRPGEERANEG
jgi:hypothetical protein